MPWADQIYQWIANNKQQMTRIHELFLARGCELSYQSLRRFVLKRNWRRPSKITVRMEDTPLGEVAEADFGRLGMITYSATGRRRVAWAMVIVLCHSRHCFVWPMQLQKLADVIAGLEAAWACFGGMPKYPVIDNFPAAVVGTDPLHTHFITEFLEYAQPRGWALRFINRVGQRIYQLVVQSDPDFPYIGVGGRTVNPPTPAIVGVAPERWSPRRSATAWRTKLRCDGPRVVVAAADEPPEWSRKRVPSGSAWCGQWPGPTTGVGSQRPGEPVPPER